MKRFRFVATLLILAATGFTLFSVPIPHRVSASFVVQPRDVQKVFVTQPGALTAVYFQAGDQVSKGELIAKLTDSDLEMSVEVLKGQLQRANTELQDYKLKRDQLDDANRLIATAEVRVHELQRQIKLADRKRSQLALVADRNGVIIPPPNLPEPPESDRTLASWSGTPLDQENANCFLVPQTLFCLVGNPKDMKATLVIDQSDAKLIAVGQQVELMFDEWPGRKVTGKIEFVSREELEVVPRELSINHGGAIATKPKGDRGEEAPMFPCYEASVRLDGGMTPEMLTGFRGVAKVQLASSPLGQRLFRYLKTVVNFR